MFYTAYRPRRKHYQYDYRHTDGELFSCVAGTSKSADNAAMNGSTRKSTTQNDRTMDNLIAKTIHQQIGGLRFAAMTGSHDFINLGNGLRMSLSRNKTSANSLVIDLWSLCFAKKSSMTRAQTSTTCGFTASP